MNWEPIGFMCYRGFVDGDTSTALEVTFVVEAV